MPATTLMRGSPPPPPDQVTLENWRTRPYAAWAFHHVRELIPTAAIPAGSPASLPEAPTGLLRTAFEDPAGAERTVTDVLAGSHVDGLVMLRAGRLVAEHYSEGYDGLRPHILFSISKSVTALLAGVLIDRGLMDADGRVIDLIPEVDGSAFEGCTLRHLLDMTVSVRFEEDYADPDGDVIRYRRATGWNPAEPGADPGDLRSFISRLRPGEERHGRRFHYVSPNSDLLGWSIERAAGRRYADLLSELIWRPMGAGSSADITVDRLGAPRAAGGISATARDLARLGELVRRRGVAHGRQVVPGWWIDDLFTAGDRAAWARGEFKGLFADGGYRSQWYQTGPAPCAVMAIGIHGQWLHVDPSNESVIAVVSSRHEPTDDAADAAMIAALAALAGTQRR